MSATFDPDSAGRAPGEGRRDIDARQRRDATLRAWFGPVTNLMLLLARPGTGDRVLDIVAGAGSPALAAAAQVGPGGYVLATDIAPHQLADAEREARRRGLAGFRAEIATGDELTLADRTFDAAISRAGLIAFPDRRQALAELHRILKPGGRVVAVAYGAPERNAFLAEPLALVRRAAHVAPSASGQTDPFGLGEPGAFAGVLREAGFRDTAVHVVHAPLRLPSAADCARFERESFGALHRPLAGLLPGRQDAVWDEIALALRRFEARGAFVAPCELLVGVGTT